MNKQVLWQDGLVFPLLSNIGTIVVIEEEVETDNSHHPVDNFLHFVIIIPIQRT